jgi:hypothetical protein
MVKPESLGQIELVAVYETLDRLDEGGTFCDFWKAGVLLLRGLPIAACSVWKRAELCLAVRGLRGGAAIPLFEGFRVGSFYVLLNIAFRDVQVSFRRQVARFVVQLLFQTRVAHSGAILNL